MGELIALKRRGGSRKSYHNAVDDVRSSLQNTAENLYSACVQLVMLGAWKEWNDRTPIGSEIYIDEEAQTSDKNVSGLMNLYEAIVDTIEWLTTGDGSNASHSEGRIVGWICSEKAKKEVLSDPAVNQAVKALNARIVGFIARSDGYCYGDKP